LSFRRWKHLDCLGDVRAWLFATPSGQIISAISMDVTCGLMDVIDLLEDCYFGDVTTSEGPVESLVNMMAKSAGATSPPKPGFLPERHQLILTASPEEARTEDVVQRLIYRANLPYRKEFSAIRYPAELNRRAGWLAAVGPYVSVVGGHPEFLESSIFASAVQAVAAWARLREIRQSAYRDVRLFRGGGEVRGSTKERRQILEQIAAQLGDMELELSFSVEASADLGLLVPSLRAEGYHAAIYESMGLAEKAQTTARMLQRLGQAISAELTAIESIERRSDENRRLRWGVAVGFVSVVAVPVGIVLAFLGINANQVNASRSMFSHQYFPMYLSVASIVVIGILISVVLFVQHRRLEHITARAGRTDWLLPQAGLPDETIPVITKHRGPAITSDPPS
jgi:hypothetical protein